MRGNNICCNEYSRRRLYTRWWISRRSWERQLPETWAVRGTWAVPQTQKLPRNFPSKGLLFMKLLAISTSILVLAAPLAIAQAPADTSTWISDPAHSEVDFSVTHLSITKVHGRFGKVAATLMYDQADVSKSAVKATIDVSTIDTSEEARNNHLKTPDFFDLANFPTATFISTSVAKSPSGLTVDGNLTLHGVTKPVVLNVEGPMRPGARNGSKAALWFLGDDHHQPFGVSGLGTKFPTAMVGDEIKLSIDLDVAKQ